MSDSLSEPVSLIPIHVSGQVVESPSHYPAPAEPVELLAVSSVLIFPNRVREDCLSVSLDVYPGTDLSVLAIPLFPLPAGMMLVPLLPLDQPSTSPERSSWREQQARAVSPSGDLSL